MLRQVDHIKRIRQDGRTEVRTTGVVRFEGEEPIPDFSYATMEVWCDKCHPCPPGYQRMAQTLRIDLFSRRLDFDFLDLEVI